MSVAPFSEDILTIAGGTGFLGRHIIRMAAAAGLRIRVLSRVAERAYICKTSGAVGQIIGVAVDYNDKTAVFNAVKGSRYVVNCVGELAECGKDTFARVHTDYARTLAEAAAATNAERFVQISALGASDTGSRYAASKLAAEQAVLTAFPAATILRPSVMFGPDDSFINRLAQLAASLPFVPLVGGGKTLFQPVYVEDVAGAVMAALQIPAGSLHDPRGRVYALGGPEVKSFREIAQTILQFTGQKTKLASLPFCVAHVKSLFLQFLPGALKLTPDQVESLRTDNVVAEGDIGFAELGIYPTAMALIIPTYLQAYQRGGKFQHQRDEEGATA